MKYTVIITQKAEREILHAASYIANTLQNKTAAERFLDLAETKLNALSEFPDKNQLVNNALLASNGVRMQRINHYLAFYVISEETKTVYILRVLHARMDWTAIMKTELDT